MALQIRMHDDLLSCRGLGQISLVCSTCFSLCQLYGVFEAVERTESCLDDWFTAFVGHNDLGPFSPEGTAEEVVKGQDISSH
jgi:hypothetical protein